MLLNLTIQCLMNVEVLLPIPSFPLPSLPSHLFPFLHCLMSSSNLTIMYK